MASRIQIEQLDLFLGDIPMGRLIAGPPRGEAQEYAIMMDAAFARQNLDIAPLKYPFLDEFRKGLVVFRGPPAPTSPFAGGLPGFIADSLPDTWGSIVAEHEDPARAATLLGLLSRVGANGVGAVVFHDPAAVARKPVQRVVQLAESTSR